MTRFFLSILLLVVSSGTALSQASQQPATFTLISQTQLSMTGIIDGRTQSRLQNALASSPGIQTIVLQSVEGSDDDDANLVLSRFIRNRGLNTHVPSNGVIASGGVDLFLAGVQRTIDPGAYVGVHSWADGGVEGRNVLNDPSWQRAHQSFISYYTEMGLPNPQGFYLFTLNAASANNIHRMSQQEIQQWGLTTGAPGTVVQTNDPPVQVSPPVPPTQPAVPPTTQVHALSGVWNEIRQDGRQIAIYVKDSGSFTQYENNQVVLSGTLVLQNTGNGTMLTMAGSDNSREVFYIQSNGQTIQFADENRNPISRFYWQKGN